MPSQMRYGAHRLLVASITLVSLLSVLSLSHAASASYSFKLVVDRTAPKIRVYALDYSKIPYAITDKEIGLDGSIHCVGGNCHFIPVVKDNTKIVYVNMSANIGTIAKAIDNYDKSKQEIDEKPLSSVFNGESRTNYYYFSEEPGSEEKDTLTIKAADIAGNINTTKISITPEEYYLELQNWGDHNGVRGWGVPFINAYKVCTSFIGGGVWHDDPGIIEFGYVDNNGYYHCRVIKESNIPDDSGFDYCWSAGSWSDALDNNINLLRAWAGRRVSSNQYGCVEEVEWKADDYIDAGGFRLYLTENELKSIKDLTPSQLSIIFFPESTWEYKVEDYSGRIYKNQNYAKACVEIDNDNVNGDTCKW